MTGFLFSNLTCKLTIFKKDNNPLLSLCMKTCQDRKKDSKSVNFNYIHIFILKRHHNDMDMVIKKHTSDIFKNFDVESTISVSVSSSLSGF